MNITKEMAVFSLRPDLNAWSEHGIPTEHDILVEQNRLTKDADISKKKALRRLAHPANANDVAELVEELTRRVLTLESKK